MPQHELLACAQCGCFAFSCFEDFAIRAKMMRAAFVVAAMLLLAAPLHAQQITLLQTSDLHGYIYPFDYFRNRYADIGVARVATMVESVRAEGRPVLLLDAGDTIQGSALAYVHQRKQPGPHEPTMLTMNRVGFDAMAVGNHEFNFGLEAMERARNDASFPWLSANVVTQEGEPFFEPYLVKELNGVKVGILGLTTRAVPTWETPENYAGLEFVDTVEAAKHFVPILLEKERVDTVVVVTHQALERDLESGESNKSEYENQVYRLTKEVPGIDVILMGHAHRRFPPQEVNGVILCEPGRWGDSLCRVDLHFEKDSAGELRLSRWDGELLSASEFESDEKVLELGRPFITRGRWPTSVVSSARRWSRSALSEHVFEIRRSWIFSSKSCSRKVERNYLWPLFCPIVSKESRWGRWPCSSSCPFIHTTTPWWS